jgi:hypothetical protein
METLAILGLTAMLGYSFAESESIRNVSDNDVIHDQVPVEEIPVSKNIYNSNMVNEAEDAVLQMSIANYKQAEEPSMTGMLPPIYNSYGAVGNPSIRIESNIQKLADINNTNRYVDVTAKPVPDTASRAMFKPLLNLDTAEPTNFSNFGMGKETSNDISLLTGKPIERDHNNMVPFFGSNTKQNVETYANVPALDRYTGNRSTFIHKSEQKPFFELYTQDIHGTPQVTTSIETDRFIPSVYRQNEKPFEQERVNAPMSFTVDNPVTVAATNYPTIDQMRTVNKPQVSYQTQLNSGKYGEVRGVQGEVNKNRVDTSFELGHSRLFTSTGVQISQAAQENYSQMTSTTRSEQNIEYYGPGVDSGALKTIPRYSTNVDNTDELTVISQENRRQQFEADYQRNIASANMTSHDDYGRSGVILTELERDTTNQMHTINANRSNAGAKLPLQDQIKMTIKETTMVRDGRGHATHAVNKSDTSGLTGVQLKTTNKETTVKNKFKGHANKKDQMGYVVANYDAKATHKETTGQTDYRGAAGPAQSQSQENRQRFKNASISKTREVLVSNQRPSGANHFNLAGGTGVLGETSVKPNKVMRPNKHTQNITVSQTTPSRSLIGESTTRASKKYGDIENKQVTPEFVSIIDSQLKDNPFYNLRRD